MNPSTDQCLVFDLPSGAGGMAAGIYKSTLLKQLKAFSDTHGVHYKTKTQGRQLKIWFEQDKHYTLFFLVYNPHKEWRRPFIVYEDYDE